MAAVKSGNDVVVNGVTYKNAGNGFYMDNNGNYVEGNGTPISAFNVSQLRNSGVSLSSDGSPVPGSGNGGDSNGQDMKPAAPVFESARNPDGTIKSPYQYNPQAVQFHDISNSLENRLGGVQLDKTALNALQSRALSTGPSPWLNLALDKQKLDEGNQVDTANKQSQADMGNAYSQLASQGGLSSGARERLARSASESSNANAQTVRNTGLTTRANLGLQDQQSKDAMLSALPGQQLQASQFGENQANDLNSVDLNQQERKLGVDTGNVNAANTGAQYNINNSLSDLLQNRAFDLNNYNQQMQAWAANKTANAMPSGKK